MIISLENVTKSYPVSDEASVTPVKNVSMEIAPGEFVMVIGHSGSGKTTLLNLAAGLVRPTSGRVVLCGEDIEKLGDGGLSRLRNRKMGFVFQFPSLLPPLTALENVALPAQLGGGLAKREVYPRAESLLQMVGLAAKLDAYPKQLSAGEQRRVVIARALMNRPELILADEPTSDLDEETEADIMDIIRGVNQEGVTILMVTHNLDLLSLSSRALRMTNARLAEVDGLSVRKTLTPSPV